MFPTPKSTPCHCRVAVGGPARVWCPVCGRVFQADDPQLLAPQCGGTVRQSPEPAHGPAFQTLDVGASSRGVRRAVTLPSA